MAEPRTTSTPCPPLRRRQRDTHLRHAITPGRRLALTRAVLDIPAVAVAAAAGVPAIHLSQLEHDKRGLKPGEYARLLAAILSVAAHTQEAPDDGR